MLYGIDISNHQEGIDLPSLLPSLDFVICKATEGTTFVDPFCDTFVQQVKKAGKRWGFYHFGRKGDPYIEADFFIKNCENYFNDGIPVLDWEDNQSVEWVNIFVKRVHDKTGIWPWIYANPWRFNQGGVEANCGRWIAQYPNVVSPALDYELPDIPDTDGLVCCWQYCSDGRLKGYNGNLDFDRFFGSEDAWDAYANAKRDGNSILVIEDDKYKVTIEPKE